MRSSINERLDDHPEEVADVSGATTLRLRGTDGMVGPLWDGADNGLETRTEGMAVGLPTMVVVGATVH